MLKATVEWRRERQPLSLDCLRCHQRPGMHSVVNIGNRYLGLLFADGSTIKPFSEIWVSPSKLE